MERFDEGWKSRWEARRLASRANRVELVEHDGDSVVRFDSRRAASALVRRVEVESPSGGQISWRWRVDRTVGKGLDPRKKAGDDYAARVFVVFDADFATGGARALCYVWSADLPIGSVFRSPYTDRVAMIVVESGMTAAERWVTVKRDFVRDYQGVFSEAARRITGVAIMVDTDNTRSQATSYFDDVVFEIMR